MKLVKIYFGLGGHGLIDKNDCQHMLGNNFNLCICQTQLIQTIIVQEVLSEVSPVVYVDIVEGDAEGHVRFKSPEDAKAIINANEELQRKHNWHLAILSGIKSYYF